MNKEENSIKFLEELYKKNTPIFETLGNRENPNGDFFVRLDTWIDLKFQNVEIIGVNHIHIKDQVAIFSVGNFSNSGMNTNKINLKEIDPTDFKMKIHELKEEGI